MESNEVPRDPVTGHLLKGARLNPRGRPQKDKPKPKLTLAEMRDYLRERLPALLDQVYSQAMAGDTQAQRMILDKCLPSLKAIHIEASSGELPVLMMVTNGSEAHTIEATATLESKTGQGVRGSDEDAA